MYWNKTTPDDERLAQHLREDALHHRSEFSESLHRRICDAIEQDRTKPTHDDDDLLPQPRRRSDWLAVALAASLILAVLLAWQTSRNAPVARLPVAPRMDLPVNEKEPSTFAPSSDPSHAEDSVVPPIAKGISPITPPTSGEEAKQMLARIDGTLASSQWAFLDHDARLTWQLVTQMLPVHAAPTPGEDW